jgi:hypothetical protein
MLGFGGQGFARPCGIGQRILMHHLHGMVEDVVDAAVGPGGMGPIRAGHPAPPLRGIGRIHRPVGHGEDRDPGTASAGSMPGYCEGSGAVSAKVL